MKVLPRSLQSISKIWIVVIILILIGGFFYYIDGLNKKIPSENNILITCDEEDEKNILLFDINLENYSVKSENLSKYYGSNFSQYGNQSIIAPKFNVSTKPPFLNIKTKIGGGKCKPETPYLNIDIDLPLNTKSKAELVSFQEKKIKEKLEIVPGITCIKFESEGCLPCPNYLKEDKFFPPEFSIWSDKSRFDKEETLRVGFPLFRHNPATRETYKIRNAKIKVSYELLNGNSVLLEEKNVPSEITTLKPSKLSYRIINPSPKKLSNLKVKITVEDSHGKIIQTANSSQFDLNGDESKVVSFELGGVEGKGNRLLESCILKDSKRIGIGSSKWIYFRLPANIEVDKPRKIITIKDRFSANVTNYGDIPLEAEVIFEIFDQHYMDVAELYGEQTKTIKPGETKTIESQPGAVLSKCQKGCWMQVVAEVKYGSYSGWLGPKTLKDEFKGYMPSYCEEDSDCMCCDSIDIRYPRQNIAVNKIYAETERYNCKTTPEGFCSIHKAICDKKYSKCKEIEK